MDFFRLQRSLLIIYEFLPLFSDEKMWVEYLLAKGAFKDRK